MERDMMTMSKEKLFEAIERYKWLFITWDTDKRIAADDISDCIRFVGDILDAEANAIEEKEPYATNTINKLREAAWYLSEIEGDIMEIVSGNME